MHGLSLVGTVIGFATFLHWNHFCVCFDFAHLYIFLSTQEKCRPLGSEALPEGIVSKTSNLEMRPLWGPINKKVHESTSTFFSELQNGNFRMRNWLHTNSGSPMVPQIIYLMFRNGRLWEPCSSSYGWLQHWCTLHHIQSWQWPCYCLFFG